MKQNSSMNSGSPIFERDLTPGDYVLCSETTDDSLIGLMQSLEFDLKFLPGDEAKKTETQVQALMDIAFYGRNFASACGNWNIDVRNQERIDIGQLLKGELNLQGSTPVRLKSLGNLAVGSGRDRLAQHINELEPQNRLEAMAGLVRLTRRLIDKLPDASKKSLSKGNVTKSSIVLKELKDAKVQFYEVLGREVRKEQTTDPAAIARIGAVWD